MNRALLSGMAGAATLTAVHQLARTVTEAAPRMDVLGIRALSRGSRAAGFEPPAESHGGLYAAALAGDLLFNSAYYSLATTWKRGTVLGILAGIGALVLPQRLGLGDPPKSELLSNRIMTVAWYTLGGLAAAATAQCLRPHEQGMDIEFAGRY